MPRFFTLALASLLATSGAQAQVLLTDSFDAENGGNSALNYSGFANWSVSGQVDLVKSGDFGITCQGGTGACVDLDGSAGPGRIATKNLFSFAAGDRVRLQFGQSGNQRVAGFDHFEVAAEFLSLTDLRGWSWNVGGFVASLGPVSRIIGVVASNNAYMWNSAWSTGFLEFDAASAGSVRFSFFTKSADNAGPIVDNMLVTQTPATVVPEPSTYALISTGLAGLAVIRHRRRR
jgi:hypothetical protein